MNPTEHGAAPSEPALGERLVAQERRLELLCAYLAGRAVRSRVEIQDLVQEIFLRALADPGAVPPSEAGEGALWGFLCVVARNTVVDVARALRTKKRSGVEQPLERSDWSRAPAAAGPGPHTAAAAGESSRRLARTFLSLAPEHRRVLGLRQFEGLSAEATARRMGRSAVAVHSLYRRALEAWQEALGEKPGMRGESPPGRRL